MGTGKCKVQRPLFPGLFRAHSVIKVYPHLGGRSPLVGCALTSGGYLGLGLLALFEFCLVLFVFLFSSHSSFTICRVTKASGRGCGASWTATQLH